MAVDLASSLTLGRGCPPGPPGRSLIRRSARGVQLLEVKLLVLVGLVALAGACSGAPQAPHAVGLVQPGRLTACVAPLGQPAAGLPRGPQGSPLPGGLVGYNVDFAREISQRLGLEPRLVEVPFAELLDAVAGHRCDVSVSSQNITASRLEAIDFVPYTRSRQRVLVASGNPHEITTIDGLCGRLVSATEGSILIDMVEGSGDFSAFGLSQACLASGRRPIEVHRYASHDGAVQALLDGTVAAHLGNPNFVFRFPDRLTQSPATLPAARQGIGVAKDRPELRLAISRAILAMIDDGTYHAILVDHLGSDERARAGSIVEAAPELPQER